MVEFKKPPGVAEPGSTSEAPLYMMQANANVPEGVGEPLMSVGQWMVIAVGGMAFSLLMIIIGLVLSWRRARRKRLAEQAEQA